MSETQAEADRARLRYESEIGGVHTTVAEVQAELDLARFYLENTTLVAPEDGRIVNLQVRPGMVAGDFRAGAAAHQHPHPHLHVAELALSILTVAFPLDPLKAS